MSKALLPRPVPVGLLVAARPRPEPQRIRSRRPARWLWPAVAGAWLGLLGLASAGLTAAALRPVPQTVTEVAYVPPPDPPVVVVEPDPPVLPGESRPPLPGMPAEPPPEPTPPPPPQPVPLDPAAAAPCGRFGTAIEFVRSPAIAF